MRLPLPRVSSDLFTVCKEDDGRIVLVSEASTIGDDVLYSRIYDDACDTGFDFVSAKTGAVVTFVYTDRETDDEGDHQVFIYKPTVESQRKVPRCAGVEIHILND